MTKTKKQPTTFDECLKDIEKAEKLGLGNVNDLYNPHCMTVFKKIG